MDKYEAKKLLFRAAKDGNVADAQAALDAGANINDVGNHSEETPLHCAASKGRGKMVRFLIEKGANVNARDRFHGTPLSYAAQSGFTDIVDLLENAAKQQGHADRVTAERKDKGPPQVGG